MDLDTIKTELKSFLSQTFRIKDLDEHNNIFESGNINSLFFIQLLVFIEKKFKVDLQEGEFDFDKLSSIKEIANLILRKVNSPTMSCSNE